MFLDDLQSLTCIAVEDGFLYSARRLFPLNCTCSFKSYHNRLILYNLFIFIQSYFQKVRKLGKAVIDDIQEMETESNGSRSLLFGHMTQPFMSARMEVLDVEPQGYRENHQEGG